MSIQFYQELLQALGYTLTENGGSYHCEGNGLHVYSTLGGIHTRVLQHMAEQKQPEMTEEEREELSRELTDIANVNQSVDHSLLLELKDYPGLETNSMFKDALEHNRAVYENLIECADYVMRATGENWKKKEG